MYQEYLITSEPGGPDSDFVQNENYLVSCRNQMDYALASASIVPPRDSFSSRFMALCSFSNARTSI